MTINVDTIGAKKVYMPDGTQAASGSLDADSLYDIVYDASLDSASGAFKIVGFPDTTLTAADYLTTANNLSDVANASTARSNLGAYGSGDNVSFGTLTVSGDANFDSGTLFVDVSTDRVGIGTTSPDEFLEVSGADASAKITATTNNAFLKFEAGTANYNAILFGDTADDNTGGIYYFHNGDYMTFRTNANTERMRINSSGNVGINTTSPGSTLDVNGDIRGRASINTGVSGTLVEGTHLDGAINNIIGNITVPTATGGCHGVIVCDGTALTITRAVGLSNMFVNGSNVASCTIAARGAASIVYTASNIATISGDVY